MSLKEIRDKKIKADDYISVLLIASYIIYIIFFRLAALISIVVYSIASLGIVGVLKIINALNKRNAAYGKGNRILLGIIAIILSSLLLNLILRQPNVTSHNLILLISYPLIIVACAGIIKGIIIDVYLVKHRILNIIIGLATIIVCCIAFYSTVDSFLITIIMISLTLLINILSRAALYLSEFGLSLVYIRNFKLFLYIISDYLVYVDRNGNIELTKL